MKKLSIIILLLSSCVSPFEKGKVDVNLNTRVEQKNIPIVSDVKLTNDYLTIVGKNFNDLVSVKLNSNSLVVTSNTGTILTLSAPTSLSLILESASSIVISTANGATAVPVVFNLVDGSVTASKLSDMGASAGQFLKYNGTTWVPTTISSGLTYLGAYDASTNTPDVTSGGFNSGEYYIVSASGTRDLTYGSGAVTWNVGDWLVWNSTNSDFDQINNTVGVTSVNGSSGVITKAEIFSGSALNDVGDVDTTGIAIGKILKWDGAKWIVSDDLSGGGAGSVTTTEINDGTIVDTDISALAAIAQSKISGLTTLATSVGSNTTALASKVNTSTTVNGKALSSNVTLVTTDIAEGTNLYYTAARAKADAILNSTAGSETDQAASVASMKSYVTTSVSSSITGKADKTTTVNGQALSSNVVLNTDDIGEGSTSFYHTTARARTAAVINNTTGSETDQAASVAAMKSYVTTQTAGAGTGDLKKDGSVAMTGALDLGTQKIINGSGVSLKGDASTILTGTVEVSGTSLIGTGTAFTTELIVGDLVQIATSVFDVTAIGSDTAATLGASKVIAAGQSLNKLNSILAYKLSDNSNALTMLSNGNIGIRSEKPNYPFEILTNNNSSQLHISATGQDDGAYLTVYNSSGLYASGGASYEAGNWIAKSTTPVIFGGIDGTFNVYTDSGQTIGDSYSPSNRMRITAAGDLGLGLTSPTEKLDVNGNVKATSFIGDGSSLTNIATAVTGNINLNGDTSKVVSMNRHTTADTAGNNLSLNAGGATSGATDKSGGDLVLSSGTSTGTGTSKIEFKTSPASGSGTTDNTPTTAMTILGNGNVGIGTTGPSSSLHIVKSEADFFIPNIKLGSSAGNYGGAIATDTLDGLDDEYLCLGGGGSCDVSRGGNVSIYGNEFGAGYNGRVTITPGAATAPSGTDSSIVLRAGSPIADVMTVHHTGNVGIGTATPTRKLEIIDNDTLVSYPLSLSNNFGVTTDLAGTGILFGRPDNPWGAVVGNQQKIGDYSGGMLLLQTETSDALGLETKMAINNVGNVGIGTTSPSEKLEVNGRVLASSVKMVWTDKASADAGDTLTTSDNIFLNADAAFGLTLPAAPNDGDEIRFVHSAGSLSTNNVTLTAGAGDTIVGDATLILDLNNIAIDLIFYDVNGDGDGDWRLK